MSIDHLLTRACTILQATAPTDDYDQTPGTPTSTTTVCELQQTASTEQLEGAAQETEWLLFLPAGTAISGADAVVVDGDQYQVSGDPWPVYNPRVEAVDHVEAKLRRAA